MKVCAGTFSVAATAASGLSVAYSSSGVRSNSGATYTMTSGTGSCTVKYDQAGDNNYKTATQVSQSVTAVKAPLSVTADKNSMTSAGAVPGRTYGISGFVNGETPATSDVLGPPILGTSATSSSAAGS